MLTELEDIMKNIGLISFSLVLAAIAVNAYAQTKSELIDQKFEMANKWLHQNNLGITTAPEQAFLSDYVLITGKARRQQMRIPRRIRG